MMSDVRRLRSLREVAQRGTVTAAAAALGYTPSAVSQQLASLEIEIGVPVLERRGRNVALTDAGRLLVEHADAVLSALERAELAVAELHGEPVGPVRIASLASAAATIVPDALCSVRAEHPGLEPEVAVLPLDQNLRELRLGAMDIAIDQTYEFAPHDRFEGLEHAVLLVEPLLLLSPAADPRDCVADAGDLPWVASPTTSSCGQSTRSITSRAGICPNFAFDLEDQFATVRLVSAGLAVAIVPSLAMQHRPDDVHVAVVPDAYRTISAVIRPAARQRPAITAMVEHLVRAGVRYTYDEATATAVG